MMRDRCEKEEGGRPPLSLNPGELIALGMKFSKRGVFIRGDIFSSKITKKCEI